MAPTIFVSIWRGRWTMRGWGIEYLSTLKPWRDLFRCISARGRKHQETTRSDSHAWSAHPTYDLLTLVAGIEPASPGFAT